MRLFEMRPAVSTPAHQSDRLGELVCSNSLKSDMDGSAPHQLKWELRRCRSLLLSVADQARVPAGAALAVDRERFSQAVTDAILGHPRITLDRSEVVTLPTDRIAIIATGPLTSPGLSCFIQGLTGEQALYFYDAISPIVDADSIDWSKVFRHSRYGREQLPQGAGNGGQRAQDGDYVNCPMTPEEYHRFYSELIRAESVPMKEFEQAMYFESCLPVEELARRGRDTLRFGPMKPVGLKDPRTGKTPYAVVQLRQENLIADAYNMVGFQNHLRYGEQQRVLRLIPGLERAEFIRLGQIHRNTFLNAPRLLNGALQLKKRAGLYFAGQICGVEGYVESIATGLVAAWNVLRLMRGDPALPWPRNTAIGSLLFYITEAEPEHFQPMNINFGLLPKADLTGARGHRRERQIKMAREAMEGFLQNESQRMDWRL